MSCHNYCYFWLAVEKDQRVFFLQETDQLAGKDSLRGDDDDLAALIM
jgi:hypothetical protein